VPIILGILVATLLNHAAAATLGYFVASFLTGQVFQVIVGVAFVVMRGGALIPDKEDDGAANASRGGIFLTTLVAFFFVEMGDKTQIATSLLAAQFNNILFVTIAHAGHDAANVPAVLLGYGDALVPEIRADGRSRAVRAHRRVGGSGSSGSSVRVMMKLSNLLAVAALALLVGLRGLRWMICRTSPRSRPAAGSPR
jgi:hypothetical protein